MTVKVTMTFNTVDEAIAFLERAPAPTATAVQQPADRPAAAVQQPAKTEKKASKAAPAPKVEAPAPKVEAPAPKVEAPVAEPIATPEEAAAALTKLVNEKGVKIATAVLARVGVTRLRDVPTDRLGHMVALVNATLAGTYDPEAAS